MRPIHLVLAAILLAAAVATLWLSLADSAGVAHAGSSRRARDGGGGEAGLAAESADGAEAEAGSNATRVPLSAPREPEAASSIVARREPPKLRGRVVTASGSGIADAAVFASSGRAWLAIPLDIEPDAVPKGWIRVEQTTTDAEGNFTFEKLEPGLLRIAVRASGFAPRYENHLDFRDEPECVLAPIRMEPGVVLAGKVIDADGKGVADATLLSALDGGSGASGAGVSLPGRGIPLGRSGGDGTFRIDELAPGPWRIIVDAAGHSVREEEGRTEHAGEVQTGLLFRLERGFEILGRVRAEDGATLPEGLRVSARPSPERAAGPRSSSETTDPIPDATETRARTSLLAADGTFGIRGVRSDVRYSLYLAKKSDEGGSWKRIRGAEPVFAWAGQRGVDLAYRPESVLLFRVLDGRTGMPLQECGVWAGVGREQVLRDEKNEPLHSFAEGRVRFGDLYPRRGSPGVVLRVGAAGFKDLERKNLALDPGQILDLGDLRLDPEHLVLLRVLDDKSGAPVEGARVVVSTKKDEDLRRLFDSPPERNFWGDSEVRFARTDADGRARLSSLPGKAITAFADARGFLPSDPSHRQLPDDRDAEIEIRLKKGGIVVVLVHDSGGRPVGGATIDHKKPGAGEDEDYFGSGTDARKTDPAGLLRFDALAPGVHGFRVGEGKSSGSWDEEGGERNEGWVETVVSEGSTVQLEFLAPSRGGLHGEVREDGRPLEGARLHLVEVQDGERQGDTWVSPGSNDPSTTSTDHEGRYEFENLRCGAYRLFVTHASRRMAAAFDVAIENPARNFDAELDVASLEGRVTGEDGTPLAGILVQAHDSRGDESRSQSYRMVVSEDDRGSTRVEYRESSNPGATTDTSGRYVLRGLQSGEPLTITATGDLVVQGTAENLAIGPDESKRGVDFVLKYAGAIEATFVAGPQAGRGGPWYEVRAFRIGEGGKEELAQMNYVGSWNRTCRLRSLAPGRYKVVFAVGGSEGPPLAAQEVDVEAGSVAKVSFQPR